MAYDHPIETDDGAIPVTLRRFLRNRLYELVALVMFAAIIAVALSLATWSIADPSLQPCRRCHVPAISSAIPAPSSPTN